MTAPDAKGRMLLEAEARAKLTLPGGEIELNKNSLKKLPAADKQEN